MNIQKVLLKVWRAIGDFVARHIDSGVARESRKASCAALRSNASKNAFIKLSKNSSRKACGSCTSRALLSLFVASATLLATFVIAPTYALSAGENAGEKVSTEKAEGEQSGSANTDAENKQQPNQSESNNNIEPNKKNNGSSDTLKNNKESKPVEKPKTAGNNGVDKAKSEKFADETAVNKKAKDVQKKGVDSAKANGNSTDRSAEKATDLPEACGGKTFKRCYVVSYYNDESVVDNNHPVLIQRGNTITIKPKFEIKLKGTKRKPAPMPSDVWFELEKYGKDSVPSWVNFKKTENQKSFDGSITLSPNSKWDYGSYKFKVVAYYKKKSEKIYATISVKVDVPDISKNDLSLSLYDFGKTQDNTAIKDSKIIINPKSKGSDSSGSDTGGTGKKDVYDPINNKLFIDSQSKDKPGFIHHHMICKSGSGDNASYTLDSVNGLNLSNKDGSTTDKQTKFTHIESKTGTDKYSVYLNDDYTERSQSWITGTPTKAGTFECKVFAIKDVDISYSENLGKTFSTEYFAKYVTDRLKDKTREVFSDPDTKIYAAHIPNTNTSGLDESVYKPQKTIDWAYKSVTIEVKSSEPQEPEIGDNDLTLKVYPFKDSTTALTSDNNKISAILGMSLKPFVDATSAADSANKITLRVLCSKGEKKEKSLVYKTWSSNLAELGLSVPADDNQNRCKKGDKDCNAAAQTSMEVSIKPTKVGNYSCVVFALKPKALTTFDDAINKLAQSGSLTPDSIKSALTTAKPTAFKENKDFAAFMLNIDSVSNFTLPQTGGQSWNLQLGILAALLVNLLAAGFVVSQSERGRKLILGRWRGLCNHV
ncbi:hypothetical protein [Gardnerella vaginalis]|uniref:hypothetical protein n=1 Tax=Gardnerella vaginalis TaxID=2702 RepID=UPI001FF562DC|nr:hypothetical protein [Gardnerella vaginalis]